MADEDVGELNMLDQVQAFLAKVKQEAEDLKRRSKELDERESALKEREESIAEKERKIEDKEKFLEKKSAELEEYSKKLEEQSSELNARIEEVNRRIAALENAQTTINEYEKTIRGLKDEMEKKIGALGEFEDYIRGKLEGIVAKQKEILETGIDIAKIQSTLSDLKEKMYQTIQGLSGEISVTPPPVERKEVKTEEKKEEKAEEEVTGKVEEEAKPEEKEEEQKFEVVLVDGEEFIKCPQCGTLNSKDAIMCYNCGYVFKPEELENE